MDEERETKVPTSDETGAAFSMRYLDDETIQLLMDDKIATGG